MTLNAKCFTLIFRMLFLIHMPIKLMIREGKRSKTRVSTAKTEKGIRNPEWFPPEITR